MVDMFIDRSFTCFFRMSLYSPPGLVDKIAIAPKRFKKLFSGVETSFGVIEALWYKEAGFKCHCFSIKNIYLNEKRFMQ